MPSPLFTASDRSFQTDARASSHVLKSASQAMPHAFASLHGLRPVISDGRTSKLARPEVGIASDASCLSYTLPPMSKVCAICGKKPSFGHNRSHSMVATKRRFEPNLQRVRVVLQGKPARAYVCTRCLKSGKPKKTFRAGPARAWSNRAVGDGAELAFVRGLVGAAFATIEASRRRID